MRKLTYDSKRTIIDLLKYVAELLGQKNEKEQEAIKDSIYYYCIKHFNKIPNKDVNVGDIVHIDYGFSNYNLEVRYKHIGIVLAKQGDKIMVVPMTSSNTETKDQSNGLVLRVEDGVARPSYLFYNDTKWLHVARVFDIKGKIPESLRMYIKREYINYIEMRGM